MKKDKKILIIGGTGFIGYHLAEFCLKKKWSVTSFSKNNPRKIRKLKRVRYVKGDLYKKKDLKKLNYDFDYVDIGGGWAFVAVAREAVRAESIKNNYRDVGKSLLHHRDFWEIGFNLSLKNPCGKEG